jgi:hypothetical protein
MRLSGRLLVFKDADSMQLRSLVAAYMPNCTFVSKMKFREFSVMQILQNPRNRVQLFRTAADYRYWSKSTQGISNSELKNVRFETNASISARSRPLSRLRELLHANTVQLSISEVGIFKRRRICAITRNCAEGFRGCRAPLRRRSTVYL